MTTEMTQPQPVNAVSNIYGVMGYDYEEVAAQEQTATAAKATFISREGKIEIPYKNGMFEVPNPADLDKPEDQRAMYKKSRLVGIIGITSSTLMNWPNGAKSPACKVVSYQSQAVDENRVPKVIQGNPVLPAGNKWDFITAYNPTASRREEVEVEGKKKTVITSVNCASCQAKSETPDNDGWFNGCKASGEMDLITTEVGDDKVAKPFIAALNLPQTSQRVFSDYLKMAKAKMKATNPMQLVTQFEIENVPAKDDIPAYNKLKLTPLSYSDEKQQNLIGTLYVQLKDTQAKIAAAGAVAAPPAQAQIAAAPAAAPAGTAPNPNGPAPF